MRRARVIFCVCFALSSINCMNRGLEEDENTIDAMIVRELPEGSSIDQINSFLKAHAFEYSFDTNTSEFIAIKRNVSGQGTVTKAIQIRLKLSDGKLISHTTNAVFTGP